MRSAEEHLLFHLTGTRSVALGAVDGLRPALFARLGDLTRLRYDYPLVLLPPDGEGPRIAALSGVVDDLLAGAAPAGPAGEPMRRAVLRLEREIRVMLAEGAVGTLALLWDAATERLASRGGSPLVDALARARTALAVDGILVDCDHAAPSRVVTHVWRRVQDRKARAMRRRIDALALRLGDLVRADHLRSEAGRGAAALRAGVGARHQDAFDFDLMAKLLSGPSGALALSDARRARIARTLAVLRGQRFFEADLPFVFAFGRVEKALGAYRARLAAMVDLVRAIAIAELELCGGYVEARHDEYFARFDDASLTPDDVALFPDYLVRLDGGASGPAGRARIIEGLTSGVPVKVLFATDDAFGLDAQLAATAMGLGDAFVLQTTAAQLYRVQGRINAAIEYPGPALISIFGATFESSAWLPPYLAAAAATESRAFPTFSYDPSAGAGWRQRFSLHDDPQPERAWPEHELGYADATLRRTRETVAFTPADLAVCDPRRADDLARVAPDRWGEHLVPVATWVENARRDDVPFVWAADGAGGLHKLVVDERLAQQVRRCAAAWKRLCELDDLRREPVVAASATPALAAVAPVPEAVTAPAAPATSVETAAAAPASDEPYIETPRCTTCNECTNVNPRMFAYNENKQAYIKDPSAGTYRDLVEAAESCQVAIIHPGKPRDPNEPGLDELLRRAEPFR